MGLGVSLCLAAGLAAMGFTGFLAISELLHSADPAWSRPRAGEEHSAPVTSSDGTGGATADDGTAHGTGGGPATTVGQSAPLNDSPLYRIGELGEVTCTAPELDKDDTESVETFAHAIADCLDDAWGDYFAGAGLEFSSPNRVYWTAAGHSPCGAFPSEGTAAFYCGANQGLYLGLEDIVAASAHNENPEAYTFLISHEYGHHVQGQSRILAQFHSERAGAEQEEADELSRRNELQANCLGGVFLGASGDSLGYGPAERRNILDDVRLRSDRGRHRTHGSAENGRMWTAHGMDRVDPASCDTWNADEGLVR
ncbi:neutral zinc metallopeptidase [Nocardiopsis sp. NRRL B-16309]|uniref:neutral zinc metallopeptidase n=1 Tax=Nocardiopsis sp. NRRL B-16309 TaxID=1519494 RepID=UPI0006AFB055|nr:neutral zinc metallopeptidase [Nocardiopsis sp. NRRL B-16309]KOX17160.1 peptidase [Nocardiopsis sp. NRRL B-16309]